MNPIFKILFKIIPSDFFARKYPVSVKGIVYINGKVLLLKNERDEWELPGGKLEPNESPEQCAVREIKEEANINVAIESMVDAWMYKVGGKVNVLILTYACIMLPEEEQNLKLNFEHEEYGIFSPQETDELKMPSGYKNSIKKATENRKIPG